MNRKTAFMVSFIVVGVASAIWQIAGIDKRFNATATTFVIAWYFFYRFFYDEKTGY